MEKTSAPVVSRYRNGFRIRFTYWNKQHTKKGKDISISGYASEAEAKADKFYIRYACEFDKTELVKTDLVAKANAWVSEQCSTDMVEIGVKRSNPSLNSA